MNMKKALVAVSVFTSGIAFAVTPAEFRQYTQTVVMTFDTEEDAQAAQINVLPLPYNKELAISSRWDDTNPAHLKTNELLDKHGMKGTFFETKSKWALDKDPDYMKKLLATGSSLGDHTMTHPHLSFLSPNEIFWQYMENRIETEVNSQSPIATTVLPYCNFYNNVLKSKMAPIIGACIQSSGLIGAPDVLTPNQEESMVLDRGTLAQSFLLHDNDKNPDPDIIANKLQKTLANKDGLAKHPCISMSMHSWHTEEGLKNLDTILEALSNHENWWYCNQNEYAAYRYEFFHTAVEKTVNGKMVTFAIKRIRPLELGARVPLWFKLDGKIPSTIAGAELDKEHSSICLPHNEEETLPELYTMTAEDGTSSIEGLTVTLTHSALQEWSCCIKNTGAPLTDVCVTFRFGPQWPVQNIRQDAAEITGETTFVAVQDTPQNEDIYQDGRPFYAVQLDFNQNGKHCRQYASIREDNLVMPGNYLRNTANAIVYNEDMDLAALSMPGTALPENAIVLGLLTDNTSPYFMQANVGKNNKKAMVYISEFTVKEGKGTGAVTVAMGDNIFVNGQKLSKENNNASLFIPNGINRIVIVMNTAWYPTGYDVKDEQGTSIIDFMPLNLNP